MIAPSETARAKPTSSLSRYSPSDPARAGDRALDALARAAATPVGLAADVARGRRPRRSALGRRPARSRPRARVASAQPSRARPSRASASSTSASLTISGGSSRSVVAPVALSTSRCSSSARRTTSARPHVELACEHQAAPAHRADVRQRFEAGGEALPELAHARQQRAIVGQPRAPPAPRSRPRARRRRSSRDRRARARRRGARR